MKQAFSFFPISAALLLTSCTQKEWQCRCYDKVQSTHPYTKSFDLGKITGSEAKERCKKLGIITDSCRTIAL
jgi:hypothetical protein